MVRIKSKKEEELPKNPDVFINEEIFMNRKDDLNKLFLELQKSESVKDMYASLENVFYLLTLQEDEYSMHFGNITSNISSEEVNQLNANQRKETLARPRPVALPIARQNRKTAFPQGRGSVFDPNEER
jgi:hypothetical protein